MNNTCFVSPSELLSYIYGRTTPVEALGRMETERHLMRKGFFDDTVLVGKLLQAAILSGSDVDVKGGFSSSLIAWVTGASKVNPLPPHYRCPFCGKTVFFSGGDGWNLPTPECCGEPMITDGHGIPIECARQELKDGKNGLYIRIASSFAEQAETIIRKHYKKRFTLVRYKDDLSDSEYQFVLIPVGEELPELDEDGIWNTDPEDVYDSGYRTIKLLPSDKKEQLQELQAKSSEMPDLTDLLTNAVMSATEERIKKTIQEKGGILLEPDTLSFSSLLRTYGYLCSTHAEDNPVFSKESAKLSDLFTCREDVWNLVSDAIKPEYGLSSELADMIMSSTRKGGFVRNRMEPETELLLRELGISEHWITQMKFTWYLPPKADLINELLDELRLTWYELQAKE